MKKQLFALLVTAALFQSGGTSAMDASIYGYKLMSPLERAEYKAEMRSLETEEERNEFLQEHRELMDERALEQGVTLSGVTVPND